MSFSIDKYHHKVFNIRTYNCWDFIREVYLDMTGLEIGLRTPDVVTHNSLTNAFSCQKTDFVKIPNPLNPCIVLFQGDKLVPHVGIYFEGKILHINKNGVQYQPASIASLGFKQIEYYICKKQSIL